MVCMCKQILLAFLFTAVGFSAFPLTSYAQGCKFQAATPGHRALCTTSAPNGNCSPTDTGEGTGKCIMLSGDNSCECLGSAPLQVLTTITVTPNRQTLLLGASQSFVARGYDANGKLMAIASAPIWSVVASGGTINSSSCLNSNSCLFTASNTVPGTFTNTVKATSGGISGFATVTVTTPVPLTGFVDLPAVQPPPTPRWALRPDAQPSIAPNSKVLLFIHGMDSRAEEADDITKALFMAMATTPHTPPPPVLPPIAANRATVQFTSCPNPAWGCPETCDHMDDASAVQALGPNYPPGRHPAAVTPFDTVNGTPTQIYFTPQLLDTPPPVGTGINVPAAHNIGANEGRLRVELRNAAAAANPLQSLQFAAFRFAAHDPLWGNAFADLSVTGHKAFAAFRTALPGEPFCQSLVGQRPAPLTAEDVVNGCRTALDRAYRVANFLRTGERGDTPALKAAKAPERTALGWIAVSGEDDAPHRPVNVPSSDFPQYDLQVDVEAPQALGQKVVRVHTRYTIAQSQTPGRNLVVISVDLPTSGYADNLNYNVVSPLSAIGQPKWPNDFAATGATPLLDFIENFVVRFAETLDQTVPFKNNIKAVMGGSLGGNMTFRLGRRPNVPWLPEFVVWSPASIWDSLGAGNDLTKHLGPRTAWENANNAMNAPQGGDRAAFFGSWDRPIAWPIIPMAQSDTWTSNYYLCKQSSVAGARLDRQETFDPFFYAWHWRLGGEQLLFSHSNIDPTTNQPLFMANHKPMLLACGLEDHVPYNDICPATQNTAQQMLTPGKAIFLGQTGHSLDNERRSFWAQQVILFLGL